MAASAVAPVVKKLDKPIQAVDSFTAGKLIQLEEKVPAVKSQPEEVLSYLTEAKEAVANKIAEGRTALSAGIAERKDSLTSQLSSKKEVVISKLAIGTEAIVSSRAGVAVSNGKRMISSQLTRGKEAVGYTIASSRDAVYSKIQCGTEYIACTKAGVYVGAGVNQTLSAADNWVDYLLPEIESEASGCEVKDEESLAQDESTMPTTGHVDKVCTLSHKVKLRMYYYSMLRLQAMQQNCQSTLQHLKQTVDLLKLAQVTRDGMNKQYHNVTSSLKDLEDQLKQLLSHYSNSSSTSSGTSWSGDDDDESGVKADWAAAPRSEGIMQSSLDYAKQLSEKVFHAFKSVTVATTYLPGHLKGRTAQGYQYAQEMYSTLKPVQSPADLKISTLNRISSLLETQLGYVAHLGTYLSAVLQKPETKKETKEPEPEKDNEEPETDTEDEPGEEA